MNRTTMRTKWSGWCSLGLVCMLGLGACKTTNSQTDEMKPTEDVVEVKNPVATVKFEIIEAPGDVYDNAALMTPVYFSFDDISLDDADKAMLDKVVTWMGEHPESAFVLEGHSDREGTREYNKDLGMERAEIVRNYMMAAGIPDARLEISSRGETQPAIPTEDGTRHWRNRRVEFEIATVPDAE